MDHLEEHFEIFRKQIVGIDQEFQSPFGTRRVVYADWIASGRLYHPVEARLLNEFGPYVANTHTETNETGSLMTLSYQLSHQLIKKHVNAGPEDVIITAGFGMTAVITKFQRILGLKGCSRYEEKRCMAEPERPVVFITHMEHHSNHTSWFETVADVVMLEPDPDLFIDLGDLERKLQEYKDRKFKIGSFTACSNVTGVETPYHAMARLMHQYGGLCFIDFAASAPYVDINMHPADPMEKLDAIFFSPHKFLGGPGSSGVLIFDKSMYKSKVPDQPGGGTVDWTNPWGEHKYIDDIEVREDGGTPGFMQSIRTALVCGLKNEMGTAAIRAREEILVRKTLAELRAIQGLHILANNADVRLGVVSFYLEGLHYNLFVKLLSDLYGIQVRGGCACAGTYGHFLLEVTHAQSKAITDKINHGDLSEKPGWVRLSLHPTMSDTELDFILNAIREIASDFPKLQPLYQYDRHRNEFFHRENPQDKSQQVQTWFRVFGE